MTAAALDPAVRLTLRAALALLFVWAASHKLSDREAFRRAIANYELVPHRWLSPIPALLGGAELSLAVGLCIPGVAAAAACAAAGLLTLYAGAIGINLARGRHDIDCGCAGAAVHQPLGVGLIVRNGVLVAAALASALPAATRVLTWIDSITLAAAVATLALLYAAVDGLLANAPLIAALVRRGDAAASSIPSPHLTAPDGSVDFVASTPFETPPGEGGSSGRTDVLLLSKKISVRSERPNRRGAGLERP